MRSFLTKIISSTLFNHYFLHQGLSFIIIFFVCSTGISLFSSKIYFLLVPEGAFFSEKRAKILID